MKPSEAMLKGFAMAGGKQCTRAYCEGDPENPRAVCAQGAINLAIMGDAKKNCEESTLASLEFYRATSVRITDANDGRGDKQEQRQVMSIPDIAAILAEAGH